MDLFVIHAIVGELKDEITGGFISKIYQMNRTDLLVRVRVPRPVAAVLVFGLMLTGIHSFNSRLIFTRKARSTRHDCNRNRDRYQSFQLRAFKPTIAESTARLDFRPVVTKSDRAEVTTP